MTKFGRLGILAGISPMPNEVQALIQGLNSSQSSGKPNCTHQPKNPPLHVKPLDIEMSNISFTGRANIQRMKQSVAS